MGLKGRVALVTGSTSGIGLGIARAFAAEGADVMLNGFGDPAAIEAIRTELTGQGVRVAYDGADLSRPDAVAELVRRTGTELGGPHILVNNAGIQHTATIAQFPAEKWDQVIAINLSAAFHAMKAAIPAMQARRLGPHHQHRLRPRAGRQPREVRLRCRQARDRRTDQGRRA